MNGLTSIQTLRRAAATRAAPPAPRDRTVRRPPAQVSGWSFAALPLAPPDGSALRVGSSDDPLEREADRAADRVMRMSEPAPAMTTAPLQLSRACAACEKDEETLRPKRTVPAAGPSRAPSIVHQALRSPGLPLDRQARSFMEARFGQDFAGVRVHTGALASASADAVGAIAYAVGRDIVFGADQYQPSTASGRRLLAHELAHVVQQSAPGAASSVGRLSASPLVVAREQTHCSGGWTCKANACDAPDAAGDGSEATSWALDVNIDTDVDTASDIMTPADVGHTNVVFKDSSGKTFSYGFYPVPGMPPNEMVSEVWGCTAHPDTTHNACFDYTEHYKLSQAQYNDALGLAQAWCAAPPKYALFSRNCTTFAVEVAKKAGQSPPSPRGGVLGGTKDADNPNTLKEGYLDQHIPTRNLTSDSDIRDWVTNHGTSAIGDLPTSEKIRLLNRLLDGYISDDDVAAFEKICSAVSSSTEQRALQVAVGPRESDMTSKAQRARVHKALFIVLDQPATPPGSAQG